MKHAFETLAGEVRAALERGEQFTLGYSAEQSQFVRFNHAKVRQAGHVSQASAQLRLIREIFLFAVRNRYWEQIEKGQAEAGGREPPRRPAARVRAFEAPATISRGDEDDCTEFVKKIVTVILPRFERKALKANTRCICYLM